MTTTERSSQPTQNLLVWCEQTRNNKYFSGTKFENTKFENNKLENTKFQNTKLWPLEVKKTIPFHEWITWKTDVREQNITLK